MTQATTTKTELTATADARPDAAPGTPVAPAGRWERGPLSPDVARPWVVLCFALIAVLYGMLWSPDWYPLSDSSLYLSLGRSLADGRGLTMMGDPVRLTPPLAPLLIAAVIKLGGGMGAIQAVMSACMLVAHGLCYLALRRIVGGRLALAATVGGALSYWVYANAFTVMSEPPCLVFLWGAVWLITLVRPDESAARRWTKVGLACAGLLLAAATRDAVVALVPGLLLLLPGAVRPGFRLGAISACLGLALVGVWLTWRTWVGKLPPTAYAWAALIPLGVALAALVWSRRAEAARLFDRLRLPEARPEAARYLALFVVVLGAWVVLYRYPPSFAVPRAVARTTQPTTMPGYADAATMPTTVPTAFAPITVGEGDDENPREGRYKAAWLYGVKRDVKNLTTQPPILGGRWVSEGLVMASVAVFETKSKTVALLGSVAAVAAFGVSIVGLVVMVRRGHWWLVGPALYFVAIWLQWGTRIKPRYMIPVAPVLFILLWAGLTALLAGRRARRAAEPATTRAGWGLALGLVGLIAVGNAYPWLVEWRVRRYEAGAQGRDFYDVARRGAFSELVDISAWLQRHAGPQENVWMNAGAQRRIAYFLSGRPIQTRDLPNRTWADWNGEHAPGTKADKAGRALRNFRRQIPAHDRFIVVYCERPAAGVTWPGWHLPLEPYAQKPNWWKLFVRTGPQTWAEVQVPRADRSYVRNVPEAGL